MPVANPKDSSDLIPSHPNQACARDLLVSPPLPYPFQSNPIQPFLPLLSPHNTHLAIISHRQPGALDIRKRHTPRLLQTPDAQAILHLRRTGEAVDHGALGAAERDGPDLAVAAVEDVDLRIAGGGDGVAGGEVGAQRAAVGVRWDGKGDGGVVFVGGAGGLRDRVVDWEAEGFRVGGWAGAGGQGGWEGGGEG